MTKLLDTNPKTKKVVTFDFTDMLDVGETITSFTVQVDVVGGVDALPQGIVNGVPEMSVDSTKVLVAIQNLRHEVTYRITVTTPTTNPLKQLTLVGFITGNANA